MAKKPISYTGFRVCYNHGPLILMIFINDLSFNLDLSCYLFADDMTLFITGDVLDKVKSILDISWVNLKTGLEPVIKKLDFLSQKIKFLILKSLF